MNGTHIFTLSKCHRYFVCFFVSAAAMMGVNVQLVQGLELIGHPTQHPLIHGRPVEVALTSDKPVFVTVGLTHERLAASDSRVPHTESELKSYKRSAVLRLSLNDQKMLSLHEMTAIEKGFQEVHINDPAIQAVLDSIHLQNRDPHEANSLVLFSAGTSGMDQILIAPAIAPDFSDLGGNIDRQPAPYRRTVFGRNIAVRESFRNKIKLLWENPYTLDLPAGAESAP